MSTGRKLHEYSIQVITVTTFLYQYSLYYHHNAFSSAHMSKGCSGWLQSCGLGYPTSLMKSGSMISANSEKLDIDILNQD